MNIKFPNYPAPAFAMTPRDPHDGSVTDLIIHHSDGSPSQSPLDVDQEHRNEQWAMIGYSYFIGGDGTVYKGRPDNVVPSAAYGDNAKSIDVCLAGDFEPGTTGFQATVPAAQLQSLKELVLYIHEQYPSIDKTIGHRDVAAMHPDNPGAFSTACPGSVLEALLPEIKLYVQQHRGR